MLPTTGLEETSSIQKELHPSVLGSWRGGPKRVHGSVLAPQQDTAKLTLRKYQIICDSGTTAGNKESKVEECKQQST